MWKALLIKYVLESTPKVHLNIVVCFVRDGEFDRMNDRGDVVLLECRYNTRFSAAEDSPTEWSGPFPDRGCNYLDNFGLCISVRTLI